MWGRASAIVSPFCTPGLRRAANTGVAAAKGAKGSPFTSAQMEGARRHGVAPESIDARGASASRKTTASCARGAP